MSKSNDVLRDAARRANMTQRVVARKMGKSESAISLWFAGLKHPRPGDARKLAKLLGLTLDEIYG